MYSEMLFTRIGVWRRSSQTEFTTSKSAPDWTFIGYCTLSDAGLGVGNNRFFPGYSGQYPGDARLYSGNTELVVLGGMRVVVGEGLYNSGETRVAVDARLDLRDTRVDVALVLVRFSSASYLSGFPVCSKRVINKVFERVN